MLAREQGVHIVRLVRLPVAGAAGRPIIVNAEQVVCIVDVGDKRSQVITTGLSGETSISLMVELSASEVADRLEAAVRPPSAEFAGCSTPDARASAARSVV
jgi:hypothetical protein